MRLTAEQINDFFKIGYVILPNLFTSEEISVLKDLTNKLIKTALKFSETTDYKGSRFVIENNAIQRIVWACDAEPELRKFSNDPRLLIPVSQLLESDQAEHLICQVHVKMPNDGVRFPWHQDSSNRKYGTEFWNDVNGKGSYVQSAIIIDEVTNASGPLKFLPGSCQLGHISLHEEKNPSLLIDEDRVVSILSSPGSVVLFHPFVIHGSEPNRSNTPRRILINGYAYPKANSRIYPGKTSGKLISLK